MELGLNRMADCGDVCMYRTICHANQKVQQVPCECPLFEYFHSKTADKRPDKDDLEPEEE